MSSESSVSAPRFSAARRSTGPDRGEAGAVWSFESRERCLGPSQGSPDDVSSSSMGSSNLRRRGGSSSALAVHCFIPSNSPKSPAGADITSSQRDAGAWGPLVSSAGLGAGCWRRKRGMGRESRSSGEASTSSSSPVSTFGASKNRRRVGGRADSVSSDVFAQPRNPSIRLPSPAGALKTSSQRDFGASLPGTYWESSGSGVDTASVDSDPSSRSAANRR